MASTDNWSEIAKLTSAERDAMVVAFGPNDKSKTWYNIDLNVLETWDGTGVIAIDCHKTVGPGCVYTKIQDAINAANAGDIIQIKTGVFNENVIVDKFLIIEGQDDSFVQIVGDGITETVTITANHVQFRRTTITGGGAAKSGLLLDGVSDCTIERNTCTGNKHGIELNGACSNFILSNILTGNVNVGLLLSASSNDNAITDDFSTGNTIGFESNGSTRNRYSACAAIANTNIGFNVASSTLETFSATCFAQYNTTGFVLNGSDSNNIMGCDVRNNATGLVLINSDNNLIYSTPFQACALDISLDVNSGNNTIAHNFYTTKTDLGVLNRWVNNHTTDTTIDTNVATISYVKEWLPGTHDVYVDKYRTDTYVETGSRDRPFKVIQDAIDYVASVAVAGQDWTIQIGTGQYVENLLLQNVNLFMISLVGIGGIVGIVPVAGNAIQSTSNNGNLTKLRMYNIEVTRPVVITGPNNGNCYNDVWIQDCKFVLNATITLNCINNFSLMSTYIETDISLTNVTWFYVDSGRLNGTFTMVCDSTINKPNGFTGGTSFINGIYEMGNVTLTKGGTATGVVVLIGSRINGSAGTIINPAGWTLQAYNSFIRGNLTNNGTFQQRGSFVEGTFTNTSTWTNNQKCSQIANDSSIPGTTVKDALNSFVFLKGTIALAGVFPVDADVAAWPDGAVGIGIGTTGMVYHLVKVGVNVKAVEMT